MTYEEAKELFETLEVQVPIGNGRDFQVAREKAIEALEKQIPKKPIWEHLGDSLSNADIITMCPSCYKGIEEDEHHCECGQAIDWSE